MPDTDPVKALAPIQRLVLFAFVCALLAGVMLVLSALHVMWTTDAHALKEERNRAARIAEILVDLPAGQANDMVAVLSDVAGLRGLTLAETASAAPGEETIAVAAGPESGKFLRWIPERPGLELFNTFAPLRVPMLLGLMGSVLACLIVMQQRVRRIESQRILARRQALRDHLTGLPNRLALDGELARLAEAGEDFSLLALDLDQFKPINDLFGHHAGDLALIEVSQRLSSQLQPGEFLARIGGDEFVAIVQRSGQRSALTQLARNCIAAVNQPLHIVGQNVSVGVSLGIIEACRDHPADALLKLADRALYEAKRLNGGAFCFSGEGGARATRDVPGEPETSSRLKAG